MDRWIEQGVRDFRQAIEQGNLGDTRRAMHSYWAQRESLSPYFVWPNNEMQFGEYLVEILKKLEVQNDASDLILRELFYASAQEWAWTSGFQVLSDIIKVLTFFLDAEDHDRNEKYQRHPNYFIDTHSMTAADLFDRLCENMYSEGKIPNLYDKITASYFSNSCLILYFSQEKFKQVGSASERIGLAQFCLRLLREITWEKENIASQYFAGIYVWAVWELARTKLLAAELPKIWHRIMGRDFNFCEISRERNSKSAFYSFPRACALLEKEFNFCHEDILVRPSPSEASRSVINVILAA